MQCNIYRILLMLPAVLVAGCSTDYAAHNGDSIIVQEQIADIENEPITRLSFVPAQNSYDEIEIVVYQDDEALAQIMPAAGVDNTTAKTSD